MSFTCQSPEFASFMIEYLSEIETEFESVLVCLSAAHMFELCQNYGRKSRDTLPLKGFTF